MSKRPEAHLKRIITGLEQELEVAIAAPGQRDSIIAIAEWASRHPELAEHELRLRRMLAQPQAADSR